MNRITSWVIFSKDVLLRARTILTHDYDVQVACNLYSYKGGSQIELKLGSNK